jgi:hypothetical protein
MIKRIRPAATDDIKWLNLAEAVEVELTSENPDSPIENALMLNRTGGWRAGGPGPQTICLIWRVPTRIRRVRLVFEERSDARTQEFVVRASTRDGEHEIVRQQFTFSPPDTSVECEEYAVNLDGVTRLELIIVPAIDDGRRFATLTEWRAA